MKKLFAIAALCAAGSAFAQTTSRLDDVMKAGKLRVCTPGDYKPFSLARPDGSLKKAWTSTSSSRPPRPWASKS